MVVGEIARALDAAAQLGQRGIEFGRPADAGEGEDRLAGDVVAGAPGGDDACGVDCEAGGKKPGCACLIDADGVIELPSKEA